VSCRKSPATAPMIAASAVRVVVLAVFIGVTASVSTTASFYGPTRPTTHIEKNCEQANLTCA
jgi:hypothetical protein